MITRLKLRPGLVFEKFSSSRNPIETSRILHPGSFRSQTSHIGIRKASSDTHSIPRRILSYTAIVAFCSIGGFIMTASPALQVASEMLRTPSDKETLTMYTPPDEFAREIEAFIDNHPVAKQLRSMPEYSESRPDLKIPQSLRGHNLTGGILMGPGRVVVPPFTWIESGGKSLVSISYLGTDLCGHPGIVHGGFLATMCDENLARCCFGALPNKIGVTANLNINYRNPVRAGAFVVLRAWTTKVEGRKAWVEGRIETLATEGEEPVVLVEASALFIEPKEAAKIVKVFPVST